MQLAQQTNIHTMQKQITTKAYTDPRQKSSKPTALKCNNYYITTKCSHLPRCTYLLCIIMASQYCLCVTRRSSLEGSVTCSWGDQQQSAPDLVICNQRPPTNQLQSAADWVSQWQWGAGFSEDCLQTGGGAFQLPGGAFQLYVGAFQLPGGSFQLPGGGHWWMTCSPL